MARIKRAQLKKTRKKNLFRRVRGFFLGRRRLRQAIEARMKAEKREFIGRKQRKRQFRVLWTQRINAAARIHGGHLDYLADPEVAALCRSYVQELIGR